MKKLLTVAILILSTFSLKAQVFVNPSLDTTYKAKGIWATSILLADKAVVFKQYAIADTNKVAGFDQYGRLTLRTKSNGGGGVVNNYLNNDSTFFKLNNGNRTAYGRVNFNNTAYEWRGILSHQYIDSGRSPTGKVWSHILQISKGFNSTTTDSLFSSFVKNDATTGFEARYNSTSGPVVSESATLNGKGFEASKYKVADLNTAPATATSTGIKGEIRYTATFIYLCIATNQWVRSPLSTF